MWEMQLRFEQDLNDKINGQEVKLADIYMNKYLLQVRPIHLIIQIQ